MLLGREIHSPSYNKYTFFKHNVHEIYKSVWWKIQKYTSCTSLFAGKYIQIAVILGEKKHFRETSLADFPQGPGSDFRVATIEILWNMIMGFTLW